MKLDFKKGIPLVFILSFAMLFMFQNCSGGFDVNESAFSLQQLSSSSQSRSHGFSEFSLMSNNNALNVSTRKNNFGFYGIVGWGANYFNEVAAFSNTVWVAKESGDAVKALDTLKILKNIETDSEKLAVLDIQDVFFSEKLLLRSDFEGRWLRYQPSLVPISQNDFPSGTKGR